MELRTLRRLPIAWVCAVLSWSALGDAASGYHVPPIEGHVTDPARRLGVVEKRALEDKLEAYRDCAKHEIAVFLPSSLEGHTVEDVAYETFRAWKIGRAHEDDGALLVIALGERRTRIETGKGVGGDLRDVAAKAILTAHVSPHLKQNELFEAIDDGTTEIAKALGGCPVQSARSFVKDAPSAPPAPPAAPRPAPLAPREPSERPAPWHHLLAGLACAAALLFAVRPPGIRGTPGRSGLRGGGICAALACAGTWVAGEPLWSLYLAAVGFVLGFPLGAIGFLLFARGGARYRANYGSGGASSGGSSDGDASGGGSSGGSSGSSSASTDTGSSYTGGGGESGGGGASDSY